MQEFRVKIGVIGCGDIAVTQHLPALSANDRCDVVFVADLEVERALSAAESFGVPNAVSDFKDGLNLGVDAVVVATPPSVTSHLAVACVEGGYDVLCEKPLAVSVDAAEAVVAAAQRTGRLVQIGLKNRFHPLIRLFREWILDGRIGHPVAIRWTAFDEIYNPDDEEHTNRIDDALRSGSPLAHEVHHLDLVQWCLGVPSLVQAGSMRTNPEFPNDNYAIAILSFEDGSIARAEASWWMNNYPAVELQALGSRGVIEVNRDEGWIRLTSSDTFEEVTHDEDWQAVCFRGQLEAFLDTVQGRPTDVPRAEVGLDVQRLVDRIETARLSSRSNTIT